jgi:hypothetical protein
LGAIGGRIILRSILYRLSQEERIIFWEVIVLVILRKKVYMNMSYSEQFPIFGAQYFPSLPP